MANNQSASSQASVPVPSLEDLLPDPPKIEVLDQNADRQIATLIDSQDYHDFPEHDFPEIVSHCGASGWAITKELGLLLFNLVSKFNPTNIVELGAGSSSVVFAKTMSLATGGCLTSIESMPQWCDQQWAEVTGLNNINAEMIAAPVKLTMSMMGLYYQYQVERSRLASRAPYDLALIDGPPYYLGRDGSLPLIIPHLTPNALIILDDAGRKGERWSISRWLKMYPALNLVYYNPTFAGRGVAIFRLTRKTDLPRISLSAIASCSQQTYLRWQRRRKGEI